MSHKKDNGTLGNLYGDMLDSVEVVSEKTLQPVGEIGCADLESDGGPANADGFEEPKLDLSKMSKADQVANFYGISAEEDEEDCPEDAEGSVKAEVLAACKEQAGEFAHKNAGMHQACKELGAQYAEQGQTEHAEVAKSLESYFAGQAKNFPDVFKGREEAEEDTKEFTDEKRRDKDNEAAQAMKDNDDREDEDEEFPINLKKIVSERVNTNMSNTTFDKLYSKVMENYEMEEIDGEELDALGISDEDDVDGEGEDEITVSLPRELAQTLCDALSQLLGDDEDGDLEGDLEDGDEFGAMDYEEDEEGVDPGSALTKEVNMGKQNKVGNLKARGAAAARGASSKIDAGSAHSKEVNMGKQNKVGNLKVGKSAFE
tara:strand:+ start:28245 stop:29363 length:1119 start_codon:yes stop_codon:yes gene_type:complete